MVPEPESPPPPSDEPDPELPPQAAVLATIAATTSAGMRRVFTIGNLRATHARRFVARVTSDHLLA
ncbi:hypothetical protein GCM10008112_05690 [Flexivirga endophytica]|nr:hypothetical protein GCM10008112_05690 [Flexivirga endophytica]